MLPFVHDHRRAPLEVDLATLLDLSMLDRAPLPVPILHGLRLYYGVYLLLVSN
jgi:hypothetical protein